MENNISKNNTNKSLCKDDIVSHVDNSIRRLDSLYCKYMDNIDTIDKADKLAYWIEDYCNYLNFEKEFNPNFLKSYSRGDIIKVNLGFNIGNEEGGLHYCIVLDKHNSKSSGIITVIPLTSSKGKKLHFSEVDLGDEIFKKFNEKFLKLNFELSEKINKLTSTNKYELSSDDLNNAMEDLKTLKKIKEELNKMKKGSIAIVSQITTISKQRIYDPQKTGDILSGLHVSDESLDLINDKVKQLFIKN